MTLTAPLVEPDVERSRRHRTRRAHLDDVERARATLPSRGRGPDVTLDAWLLHVRYERTRSDEDLAALVEEYTDYALAIAQRMHRRGEPLEDLQQVALEWLVVACQRFSVDRGIPFVAFATPTIIGGIKRHYRDRGWALRTPRRSHDLAGPIRTAREDLAAELGRPPTLDEVAHRVGVSPGELDEIDRALRARALASLDAPLPGDGLTLGDTVGTTDRGLELATDLVALSSALEILDDRDREILSLYFIDELSQRQIATRFGVSQMQVSRWLTSITGRLRSHMAVSA